MSTEEVKLVEFEFFHPSDFTRRQSIHFNLARERTLYTVLPEGVCQRLGEPSGTFVRLLDFEGRFSKAELWAIGVRYKGRQCITMVIPSKGEETELGFLTLAQLGLTYKLTEITVPKDSLFNALAYDFTHDVYLRLYEVKEALDVYGEILEQFDEDWIMILRDNPALLKSWRKSSFVVWFMSMYFYSLNAGMVSMLVGLYPYTAVAYRQALEGLIAAYLADTYISYEEVSDPLSRWDIVFHAIEKTGFTNIVDNYFKDDKELAIDILSIWKELSRLFTHARGILYTFRELSSIAMGLPHVAYVEGDREPLLTLNNSIKVFRKIFRKLFDKWLTTWLRAGGQDQKQ